jgi:hypothetical protein
MGAFDGELYRIRARIVGKDIYGNSWQSKRERHEDDKDRVPRIVAGFKGQGADAVRVDCLHYVTRPDDALSFGDVEELADEW